mgnify:CR=1 FL=1
MFSIICTMLVGVVIGHFVHEGKFVHHIEKSTSLTITALLFVLGLSIGSRRLLAAQPASSWKTWGAWDGRQPY